MKATQNTLFYDMQCGTTNHQRTSLSVLDESTQKTLKESNIIGLYPSFTQQIFEGYGCAMTETSCYLLSKMAPQARQNALKLWFGPSGMDAKFIRIPIDSCDYSLSEYQAVADPIADPDLLTFNIDRDRQYILPIVKEALALCDGKLSVLLSPWSPPSQWKTPPEMTSNDLAVYGSMAQQIDLSKPGRCFGGRLKPEYYGPWAAYLVKFVQAYLDEGIPVTMLSVQNEAAAATMWDSCVWSGEQEKTFLRDYLYPAMKDAGLTDQIGIFIWDHNKERMIEHIEDMMQSDTMDLIEGFAYHWYSGDHFDALSLLHSKYPEKVLMHSESCGLHIPGKALPVDIPEEMKSMLPPEMLAASEIPPHEVDFKDAVDYAHDIIGDLNHGMQRWIDWNMIVDRTGGPRHVGGGFCAPLVYENDGSCTRTVSFEYLLEIAKTIQSGSQQIGTSVYSTQVEVSAAKNPDGSIGVILLNKFDTDLAVSIRFSGHIMDLTLPAHTLNSVLIF